MNPFSSLRSLALAGLFLLGGSVPHAHAATFTVSNLNDSGGGSLRRALNSANATSAADTIVFAPRVFGSSRQTIALSASLPAISAPVTITGPSTPGAAVTLNAKGNSGIFTINSGVSLTLSLLTLTGGKTNAGSAIDNNGTITMSQCTVAGNSSDSAKDAYGAFYNKGTATVSNCVFSNNSASGGFQFEGFGYAGVGGAICNEGPTLTLSNCTFAKCSVQGGRGFSPGGALYTDKGTVKVSNCTFTGNSASFSGGAISNYGSLLELSNCTFTRNSSSIGSAVYNQGSTSEVNSCTFTSNSVRNGGAIHNQSGTLKLSNSIVVGNGEGERDLYNVTNSTSKSTFISGGYNLVGYASGASFAASDKTAVTSEQVKLGALADNGGPTQTLALLAGSIAIDAGQTNLTTDQRGVARPQESGPDIGAFEVQPLPSISINSPSVKEGNSGTTALTFTLLLSQASLRQVSVLVNTSQLSAKAGSDYVSVGRATVTFAPGATTQTFTVQVIGDTQVEGDEIFQLDLRSPVNATLSIASGIGTITEDDSTPKSSTFAGSAPSA